MNKTPDQLLHDYYVGKVVAGFEFGDETDTRNRVIGKTIVQVDMGSSCGDPVLYLLFADDPSVFIYANEIVNFS
jgi:hypothetical protein